MQKTIKSPLFRTKLQVNELYKLYFLKGIANYHAEMCWCLSKGIKKAMDHITIAHAHKEKVYASLYLL